MPSPLWGPVFVSHVQSVNLWVRWISEGRGRSWNSWNGWGCWGRCIQKKIYNMQATTSSTNQLFLQFLSLFFDTWSNLRTVASPMEGGIKQKTSARQTSSSARAFREVVPRADRARRMQQMHGSQHDDAPGQMDGSHHAVEAGSPRGLSLRQLRPVMTIRPPRSRRGLKWG